MTRKIVIFATSFSPVSFAPAILIIALSVILREVYTEGDIRLYSKSYDTISGLAPAQAYRVYGLILGSREPIYFVFAYVSSNLGVPYDLFKVVLSAMIALATARYLHIYGVSLASRLIVSTTNFYLIALYTEAERLGLAMLFVILSGIAMKTGRNRMSIFLISVASLAHFQILLLLFALIFRRSASLLLGWRKLHGRSPHISRNLLLWSGVAILTFFSAFLFLFGFLEGIVDSILEKVNFYFARRAGVLNLAQAALLLPVLVYLSRKPNLDIMVYGLMALPAIFIGEERINILLVFYYFAVVLRDRRWGHPLNLLVLIYFSVKGVLFIDKAIMYGRGY